MRSGPVPLRPAESDPAERDRRAAALRETLTRAYPGVGAHQAEALDQQVRQGYLSEWLWQPREGGRHGYVVGLRLDGVFRLVGVWTEPAGTDALAALVDDAEASEAGPVGTVTDLLPGIPDAEQARWFGEAGFWHRAKVGMRRPPASGAGPSRTDPRVRPIARSDLPSLVDVYQTAYAARPGEFWTWSQSHARDVAEDDVMRHRTEGEGWSADFWPELSFVAEVDGRIVGGLLMTRSASGGPHVDDLIVAPRSHRQGIGRGLLERAIEQADRGAAGPITLSAIRYGAPYRLYRSLGFEELPLPEGRGDGAWVRGPSPY